MAPRRGGGGGSGGGSFSSDECDTDWPCTSELEFMYGNRFVSYFTNGELYGQIVMAGIWIIALGVLLVLPRKSRGAVFLYLCQVFFIISFILVAVRYGLILGENNVPIAYRYESSVVVLLQRLAMVFLFAGVHQATQPGLLSKIGYGVGIGVYAILNVVYIIFDFLVSHNGLEFFKDEEVWRVSDRDFTLTMDNSNINLVKTAAAGSGLSPGAIADRFYDEGDTWTDFLKQRDTQVKIGVAADTIAFVLALSFIPLILMTFLRRRKDGSSKVVSSVSHTPIFSPYAGYRDAHTAPLLVLALCRYRWPH